MTRAPSRDTARWAPSLVVACALLLAAVPARGQAADAAAAETARLREAQLALLPEAVAALAALEWWESGFVTPVAGRLSSGYGWRNIAVNGNRFHAGIDLAAASGTAVVAARSGVVTRAGWWGTYGYVVVIDHGDGAETRYAHLSSFAVAAGDAVRQGDVIGAVGSTGASTGPHLHFEIRFEGAAVDPLPYLQGER